MRRKTVNRWLSILLVLAMLLSMAPGALVAGETSGGGQRVAGLSQLATSGSAVTMDTTTGGALEVAGTTLQALTIRSSSATGDWSNALLAGEENDAGVMVFNPAQTDYTLPQQQDTVTQLRFWYKAEPGVQVELKWGADGAKILTEGSNTTETQSNKWANCLSAGRNVLTLALTPQGETVPSATYTFRVDCLPSLTKLSLSADGKAVYLDKAFAAAENSYTAAIAQDCETVAVSAVPRSSDYTLHYNGTEQAVVPVAGVEAIAVTVSAGGLDNTYQVALNKAEALVSTVTAEPAEAIIRITDEGGLVLAQGRGPITAKGLLMGSQYHYTVTAAGYVGQQGALIPGENPLITLAKAEPGNLPNYSGDWPSFRGNPENMGVTAAATPSSAQETMLKWAQKYGSGWGASPTPPIIVNDDLYVAAGSKVMRIDRRTGDKLAESEPMVGAVGFAMNPITYGGGMVYVPVGNGQVQALNAETLASVWVSEALGGQTVSPVTYHNGYVYTGTWNSENAEGTYFCLSVTDEDPASTNEIKLPTWQLSHTGGFYWAGAYATDNYVIFGSDDGTAEGDHSANGVLYSVDPVTGEILDTIAGIKGDIRSAVAYDRDSDAVYCTTKGGLFIKVRVNADGTFDHDSYQTLELGGMSTGTPLVYQGTAFVGAAGPSQFSDSGHSYKVVDVETMTVIATDETIPGYVQTSALLSSAYAQETGKVYIYLTYNYNPGGIYMLEYDLNAKTLSGRHLFVPPAEMAQYCVCSLVCDREGVIYYKNDSGYLMAVERNSAYLSSLSADSGTLSPAFVSGTVDYELVVPAGTQQVTLAYTAAPDAVVTVNGGTGTRVVLTEGKATADIAVNRDGISRRYMVSIREASADVALTSLKVNESNSYTGTSSAVTPEFDLAKTVYVGYDISASRTFVNIWPEARDANAAVKVYAVSGVADYAPGEEIDVTASNGGHNRYAVYFADETSKAAATVKVTVTAEDNISSGDYMVVLTKGGISDFSYISDIQLSAQALVFGGAGESAELTAAVTRQGTATPAEPLVWSSSNENVATVDQNGKVTCTGGGTAVITAAGTLTAAECAVTAAMPITIQVAAYDYNAVDAGLPGASASGVIMTQPVTVPGDSTAAEAVAAAFAQAGVPLEMADGYVSAINGLDAAAGGGYSGWCLSYNNDDFTNQGLSSLTLSNNDQLAFHYTVNPDKTTDDIGSGWYGLPIVTSFTLADQTIKMGKETVYDDQYNAATKYFIYSQQGLKLSMQGSGTPVNPFIIPVTVPAGTDIADLPASYTASLSRHYHQLTGLSGELSDGHDYTNGLVFALSTNGGKYVSHYKVQVTVAGGGGGGETPDDGRIGVTFRLIGATLASEDVDLSLGINDSSYVTWIKTTEYRLPEGATVYDLFAKALNQAGLDEIGASRNYVETIYAPAILGGYALSEFTNGKYAGWMYTVNGSHPAYGLKEWRLDDGDQVVWHYVNDYRHEVEDWFDDPDYPALGDGSYWNKWLLAEDVNPSSSTVIPPAVGGSGVVITDFADSRSVTVTVKTAARHGAAEVAVTDKIVQDALKALRGKTVQTLVIIPEITGDAADVTVTLTRAALEIITGEENLTVAVAVPGGGQVTLSAETLWALSQQSGSDGISITINTKTVKDAAELLKHTPEIDATLLQDASAVLEIGIRTGNKAITGFADGLGVQLPADDQKHTLGQAYQVIIISADGTAEMLPGTIVKNGDQLAAAVTVNHLSTFVLTDQQVVLPVFAGFDDVAADAWYYPAVRFAVEQGLLTGISEQLFAPDDAVSRAMLVTILWRMADTPAAESAGFTDVAAEAWYGDAVAWARQAGVISGYGDGIFGPNDGVTREQMAAILYNYARQSGDSRPAQGSLGSYADNDAVTPWAREAMTWAVGSGLIAGMDQNHLAPGETVTRAQAAALLMRYCQAE